MTTGWLIQKRAVECGILPEDILTELQRAGITANIVDIDINNRLIGEIDKNVQLWSSLGTIEFQKRIHLIEEMKGKHHYPFFAPELHQYMNYQHQLDRALMLNTHGMLLPLSDFVHREPSQIIAYTRSKINHIRPDNCLKVTEAAQVDLSTDDWSRWLNDRIREQGQNSNMLFWLFPSKVIKSEYRTIISNKKVIGASGYPHNFKNLEDYNSIVPEAVISLAESAAKDINISDKIYILDVAETDLGYKVIELNCLATSGWYNIEAKDIVPHLDWHLKSIQKELYL